MALVEGAAFDFKPPTALENKLGLKQPDGAGVFLVNSQNVHVSELSREVSRGVWPGPRLQRSSAGVKCLGRVKIKEEQVI